MGGHEEVALGTIYESEIHGMITKWVFNTIIFSRYVEAFIREDQ
jgi:hypothetical protein